MCEGKLAYVDEMGDRSPGLHLARGDSNSEVKLKVSDPIDTLVYACAGGTAPTCLNTADTNNVGGIDGAEATFVLQYLFVEGPMIPQPYPGRGIDPTEDEVGCESFPPCE
jgi:hypothetical protein